MSKLLFCPKCQRRFVSNRGLSMHTYRKHRESLLQPSPPTKTLVMTPLTTYRSTKIRPKSLFTAYAASRHNVTVSGNSMEANVDSVESTPDIILNQDEQSDRKIHIPKNVFNDDLEKKKWQAALNEYDKEQKNKQIRPNNTVSSTKLSGSDDLATNLVRDQCDKIKIKLKRKREQYVKRLKSTKSKINGEKRQSIKRLSYKIGPAFDLLDVYELKTLLTEMSSLNIINFELTNEEKLLLEAISGCSNLLDISIIMHARSNSLKQLLNRFCDM